MQSDTTQQKELSFQENPTYGQNTVGRGISKEKGHIGPRITLEMKLLE